MEGDTTAFYLDKRLRESRAEITTLSPGEWPWATSSNTPMS